MKRSVFIPALGLLAIVPCGFAIVDVNENGLSDLWEKQYNDGQLFGASFDSQGDEDGDGWSNAKEALSGTDPLDGTPPAGLMLPQMAYHPSVWVDTDNDGIVDSQTVETAEITWLSLIGKQYQLFGSPDLLPGTWLEVDAPRMGTGGEIGLGIPLRQPDGSVPVRLFWRVAVRDVDTDGDTLTDHEEHQFGTNPNLPMTHPGIPDAWLVANFTNAQGFDPNGDPDGDGINNALENQLGLNPNHFDKTGPVNFGFDEIISESPDMSFRTAMFPLPSDLYDQTSIPGYNAESSEFTEGWQADTGSHIEIWKESGGIYSVTPPAPASQYVELQSHMEAHGVKQEFNMLPGTRLNFILCYKGRYAYDAYDNEFDLKVEGASELLVDGSPVSATGTTRSKSFMNDDDWDKYTDWHYATISITAEAGSSGLKKITLSFVPKTTTEGEEGITYGGFVDLLQIDVINPDDLPLEKLKIAKMIEIGVLNADKTIIPSNDRDSFRVRVRGGASLGGISVKVSTADNPVPGYNDDPTRIDLVADGDDAVSKDMIMVSDDEDDDQPIGGVADDNTDDQSHKIQLGGNFKIDEIKIGAGAWQSFGMKVPAPVEKTVQIHAVILRDKPLAEGGVEVVLYTKVAEYLQITQERYAQVGVKIEVVSVGIQDPPSGVDLSDGLKLLVAPSDTTIANEARTLIQSKGTVDASDIHIFFVNRLGYGTGPLFGLKGRAFADFSLDESEEDYTYNAFVAADEVLNSIKLGGLVTAHELGHLVRDAGHASSVGGIPDILLMIEGGLTHNDGVLNSKRLGQNDEKKILENSHAQ